MKKEEFKQFEQSIQLQKAANELKDYDLFNEEYKFINDMLFYIAYSKVESSYMKRYHKIVLDGALSALIYSDSNVIGMDYKETIESLKKQYIKHLELTIKQIK